MTYISARDESLDERANAKAALFRLRLLNPDAELSQLASEALEVTTAIHRAPDEAGRAEQSERSQLALLAFVEAASGQVRAGSTGRQPLEPPGGARLGGVPSRS
ncbi:hypothetical protein GCM10010149_28820 [Nonomuraea roseoviolacea subsp. roseoviolacea]